MKLLRSKEEKKEAVIYKMMHMNSKENECVPKTKKTS